MINELLFIIGLIVVGVSVVSGIITFVIMSSSWKRLNIRLDAEYGKKRR